jgi:hypothetical protein
VPLGGLGREKTRPWFFVFGAPLCSRRVVVLIIHNTQPTHVPHGRKLTASWAGGGLRPVEPGILYILHSARATSPDQIRIRMHIISPMAGLATFDQKNSIKETTPINTAFSICFSRRKNELLNRLPSEVRVLCF